MRIIAPLPLDSGYFRKIQPTAKWHYIWEHEMSDRLRVCANVENPWNQGQWEIKIHQQKSKWEGEIKTSRIDFECHPIQHELQHCVIEIEEQRGGIPHSTKPTLIFYPIPGQDRYLKVSIIAVQRSPNSHYEN